LRSYRLSGWCPMPPWPRQYRLYPVGGDRGDRVGTGYTL
jgi:hypothetical protein